MKSTGVARKVDELGRVVIPKELRKTLDINIQDSVEIFVDNDMVILRKYAPFCIFCGQASEIIMFKEKYICRKCKNEMAGFEDGCERKVEEHDCEKVVLTGEQFDDPIKLLKWLDDK